MKPPKFHIRFHKSTGSGSNGFKFDPNNTNFQHQYQYQLNPRNYRPVRIIPLILISSLWLSPSLQQKTTSWIDKRIITNRGLISRDEFYYRNNLYTYGLDHIPKASLWRRLGSWMIDGFIVSMLITPMIKFWRFPTWLGMICSFYFIYDIGTILHIYDTKGATLASVVWFGRDIWFQRFGLQSPGRYMMGIYVISTNGIEYETWNTMKLNSIVAILLGASDFIKNSMYSNAAWLTITSRGNKQQREAWIVLFGIINILIGMCTALGYGLAASQLVISKQTWFDKIAHIQVVNAKDLPLAMPLGYNQRRMNDMDRKRIISKNDINDTKKH